MKLSILIPEFRRGLCLKGNLSGNMANLVRSDLCRLNALLPCEIDLSGIESIDDSGVDLLLALKEDGMVKRFIHHSHVVLEALRRRQCY